MKNLVESVRPFKLKIEFILTDSRIILEIVK